MNIQQITVTIHREFTVDYSNYSRRIYSRLQQLFITKLQQKTEIIHCELQQITEIIHREFQQIGAIIHRELQQII